MTTTRRSYRSTDNRLNPALAAEVAGLRGGMTDAAEQQPLPVRFDAVEHPDRPAMIITDLETGRRTTVSMFAYRSVRQALNDLLGDVQ